MNNIYGYIRVSTISQREDRQWAAMDEFGVPHECVFVDKQSGKDFDRPAWNDLMARLSENDTLVVNIKTPHLIQSHFWVQSSKSLATRGFGDFDFFGHKASWHKMTRRR